MLTCMALFWIVRVRYYFLAAHPPESAALNIRGPRLAGLGRSSPSCLPIGPLVAYSRRQPTAGEQEPRENSAAARGVPRDAPEPRAIGALILRTKVGMV